MDPSLGHIGCHAPLGKSRMSAQATNRTCIFTGGPPSVRASKYGVMNPKTFRSVLMLQA